MDKYIDQTQAGSIWHSLFSMLAFKEMSMEAECASAILPAKAEFRQNTDSGTASAWLTVALDTLLGMAVFGKIMKAVPIATVDLSTDFITAPAAGEDVQITARCDVIVDNTAFVSGEVRGSGTGALIARASAKFIIKGKPQKDSKKPSKKRAEPELFSIAGAEPVVLFEEAKDGHPYAKWLEVQELDLGNQHVMHLPFREEIIGDPFARTIHGGMLASIMEMAATGAIIQKTGTPDLLIPLSSSVNYLKKTFAADCFAGAKIVRFGRNIIVVHARAWQEEQHTPVASATFLFKGLEAG